MLLKMWCGLLSIALVVTSIGCQTGGAMRSLKKTTVVEQLEYFKKGDEVKVEYFDLQGKKKKVTGVIREITQKEIVLWGDPIKNVPDTRIPLNLVQWIDIPPTEIQVQEAGKEFLKAAGTFVGIVGVIALAVYLLKKNFSGTGKRPQPLF